MSELVIKHFVEIPKIYFFIRNVIYCIDLKLYSGILYITRLLGRFAPIFHFHWQHVLFVYIVKQKQTKTFADIKKKFRGFKQKNFMDFNIPKPSLGSREIPQKNNSIKE